MKYILILALAILGTGYSSCEQGAAQVDKPAEVKEETEAPENPETPKEPPKAAPVQANFDNNYINIIIIMGALNGLCSVNTPDGPTVNRACLRESLECTLGIDKSKSAIVAATETVNCSNKAIEKEVHP
jgi:hypothetical protein